MTDNLLLSLDSTNGSVNDSRQDDGDMAGDAMNRSVLAAEQAVAAARSIQSSAEELKSVVDGELITAQRRESHLRRSLSRQEARLATKSSEYHALAAQALATSSRLEQRLAESEEARAALAMELTAAHDRIAELETLVERGGRMSRSYATTGMSGCGGRGCTQCAAYLQELEELRERIAEYETKVAQRTTAAQMSVEELAHSLAHQKRIEAENKAMRKLHAEEVQRLQNELAEKDALLEEFNSQLKAANEEVLEIHESQVRESKLRACGVSLHSDAGQNEDPEVLKSRIVELEEEAQCLRNAIETDHQEQLEKADDINILRDERDALARKTERAENIIYQLKKLLFGISDVCMTGADRIGIAWESDAEGPTALEMTVGSKRVGFY
ncbi:hypothetical protein GMRT_12342 [Giardia muris]|uniref:Uncharacterized protein n=1 Tax=Giardia muris TaxID=5742 RepID=A0A4Z1SNF6_GIAMU|nr:hypothetical protein GMRT_12342 [Giardia muris]|eukprot:TNJ27302.1 hypothetical protein GMRT_12342 [Giardia muris]